MCSLFWQGMENDHGDLADIVRAGSGGGTMINPTVDWQFPSQPTNLSSATNEAFDDFGDPFLGMPDPLLHELDLPSSVFFNGSNSAMAGLAKMNIGEDGSGGNFLAQKIVGDEMKIRPCNIFSRMLHVSPTTAKMAIMPRGNSPMIATSQRGIKPSSIDVNDMIKLNSTVQISAPRSLGIKRRKSQAKKVVCIPAPAAANNRPSGEVVPSDNWHWRKYGQKPIKGSPYPRGYYRCSSSKGCSARKQVERSRNDPNMFVITYTSDHNHPWPTQRNALAGSTRSHPMRNNAAASKNLPFNHTQKPTTSKEEHKDNEADNSSSAITVAGSTTSCGTVKEEMGEREKEKPVDNIADEEYEQGFNHSYRSFLLDHSNQSGDFFADLGELEPDPLSPMFSQGFSAEKSDEERATKALDPFNLFDWSEN